MGLSEDDTSIRPLIRASRQSTFEEMVKGDVPESFGVTAHRGIQKKERYPKSEDRVGIPTKLILGVYE